MFTSFKLLIKKLKYFIIEPDLNKESNVRFIHQKPRHYNIGDDLCSPKHYFEFQSKQRINILGGGVEDSLYQKKIDFLRLDPKNCILWGVGQSNKKMTPKFIHELPYLEWGSRDIDCVNDTHFLPCVSCLHSMLDLDILNKNILIFLNYDKRITSPNLTKTLKINYPEYQILYNNCTEIELKQAFQNCDEIITNSFHGAYWGFLSGHKVSLIGYSSKFYSLIKAVGLDTSKLISVQPANSFQLLEAINKAKTGEFSQKLINHNFTKSNFRSININFANKLKSSGLFNYIDLKNIETSK